MQLIEAEIERILREHIFLRMPRGGRTNASVHGYLTAAHIIAERVRGEIIYEEKVLGKFISTPSLDCDFLALKGFLFDAVKIPVYGMVGPRLDGQQLVVTVKKGEGEDANT